EQVYVTKIYHACNYLQGSEGNVDPQHLSFLHVSYDPKSMLDPVLNSLISADVAPRLDIEETPFGYRIFAVRKIDDGQNLIRITNFIMPNCSAFDGVPLFNFKTEKHQPNLGYQIHWHVPIDDTQHWKYTVLYRYDGALDKEFIDQTFFNE